MHTGDWFQMGRTDLDSVAASHPAKPGSERYHNNKRGKGLMAWLDGPHGKRPQRDQPVLACWPALWRVGV